MNKPNEYITEMFRKLREDISGIKNKLFTEKPKLESVETKPHYSVDAIHKDGQSHEKDDKAISVSFNLPESIRVDAKTEERHKPWYKDRSVWLQIVTIVVGAIVAIIYGFQLSAMNESNRFNHEALVSVQRGFLNFMTVNQDRKKHPNGWFWHLSVAWENSGNTQARGVVNGFDAKNLDHEPSEDQFTMVQDQPWKNPVSVSIGAHSGASTQELIRSDTFFFGRDLGDLAQVKPGEIPATKNVYMWGWTMYRDVFVGSDLHLTEFCVRVTDSERSPDGLKIRFPIGSTGKHNCTDKDCEDYQQMAATYPK